MRTGNQQPASVSPPYAKRAQAVRSVPLSLATIAVLLAALLVAIGVAPLANRAYAASDTTPLAASSLLAESGDVEAVSSDEMKGIYASFPSETNVSEDLSSLFYYSDSLFANSAATYSDDLAHASVNLAAAADNSNTGGSDYASKANNIKRLLQDMGCSDVTANDGYEKHAERISDCCAVYDVFQRFRHVKLTAIENPRLQSFRQS